MFPAFRQPIPVWVEYDCRGKRARKWFDDGLKRPAKSFYAAKQRAGKNPRVVKATAGTPSLFPDLPADPETPRLPD